MNKDSACNKYDPKIVSRSEDVNKEIEKFIMHYNKGDIFKKALNIRICIEFNTHFLSNYSNPHNPKRYREIRKEILEVLNKEIYKDALKKVKFKDLLFLEKILVFLLKLKWIFVLKFLMKVKDFRKKLRRREVA